MIDGFSVGFWGYLGVIAGHLTMAFGIFLVMAIIIGYFHLRSLLRKRSKN